MCQPEDARISFSYQGRLWLAGATFSLAAGNGLIRPKDCGLAEGILSRSAAGCSYTITYAGKSKTALSLRFRTSPDVPGVFLKMSVENHSTEPLIIFGFNIIEALGGKASFWPGYGGTNGAVFDWGFQSLSPAKVRRAGDSYVSGISEFYLEADPGIKPFSGQNQFISSWICGLCSGTAKEKALMGYLHPNDQSGYFLYRHVDRTEDFLARSDAEGLSLESGGTMSSEELYITLSEQEERLVSEFFSLKGPVLTGARQVGGSSRDGCDNRDGCDSRYGGDAGENGNCPCAGLRVRPGVVGDPEGFFDTIFIDSDLTGEMASADVGIGADVGAGAGAGSNPGADAKLDVSARLKEAVSEIRAAGYRPALWWSPFAAYRDGALLKNKPQWALRSNGKMVPAGAINGRKLAALDVTNPEVAAYLSAAARKIYDDWGYQTVVLDRLYLATLTGKRHNEHKTRIGAFHDGLSAIRSAIPVAFLIGRGCPFGPAAGLLDAVDIGAEHGDRRLPRKRSLFQLLRKKTHPEIQPLNNLLLRSPAGGVFWKNAILWQDELWVRFTPKTAAALAAFGGEVAIFDALDGRGDHGDCGDHGGHNALAANPEFRETFAALHAPKQRCTPGPGWMTTSAIKSLIIKSEQRQGLFILEVNTGNVPDVAVINPAKPGLCTAEGGRGVFVFDRFASRHLGTAFSDQAISSEEKLAAGDSHLLYLVPDAGVPTIVGDDLPLDTLVQESYVDHTLHIIIKKDAARSDQCDRHDRHDRNDRIAGNLFISVPAMANEVLKIPVEGVLSIELQYDFNDVK